MQAISLVFLCIFIFSAYAYGATVLLALRQIQIWGPSHTSRQAGMDRVTLAICAVSTLWFALHAYMEFSNLVGMRLFENPLLVLLMILSYSYPPLIMHTVLNESETAGATLGPSWRRILTVMYVVSLVTAAFSIAAAFNFLPRPQPFGKWAGISIGALFTICSVYCMALLTSRQPSVPVKPSGRSLHRTMLALFGLMVVLFFALIFLQDQRLLMLGLERITRVLPMLFLIASVYHENRFEFYDLIVKRAATLAANLLVMGLYLWVTLSALERFPTGPARPWLFAIALLPLGMLLTSLHPRLGQYLDRMWFGREFTPVEAVKQVLSAMQPATTERALVEATESRLSEMFRTRVRLLVDEERWEDAGVELTIASVSSPSGTPLRVAVDRDSSHRPLLSEDLALLRSLGSVFGFMLENVRLQQRRQEQDLVARELRLQTSRSELKALRAQINPHFLFNALNAIASLIHTDPARADAAVEQLAEVFRYTLRRSEQEWAPLDQELAFARAYLDVEQARFGRRLSFAVAAPPASGAQVPSMLLQTLVENAVKHGISQVRGAGRIEVHARAEGETLILEVTDSGPGPHASGRRTTEGEGFGLRSVRDRLRGHFGERASLALDRDQGRGLTIARIAMPLVTETAREATLVREPA